MFETYQKRSMYIICALIFCMLIDSCSSIDSGQEKDYIYYNWCEGNSKIHLINILAYNLKIH